MGSFFTNVQVHTGGRDPGGVRGQVVEVLRRWVLVGPYEEVVDPGDADRMIAVGPAGECPWVAVFDDATESQEESKLLELAVQLSKELNTPLVTISVHDSDVLSLNLMSSGELVDAFCNAPEYFEPVPKEEKARVAGNPFMWAPLLVDGATPSDLNAVWCSDPVFADEIVEAMAPMVGWHPELCQAGYDDLGDLDMEGVTYLYFRDKGVVRASEARRAAGPACLQPLDLILDQEYVSGQPFELKFSGQNTGGGGTGLTVVLYGPALEESLISPSEARVRTGLGSGGQNRVIVERRGPVVRDTAAGGETLWLAHFPDFPLIAGASAQLALVGGINSRTIQDLASAWAESQVVVTIIGKAGEPGAARCFAGIIPEENEAGGFVVGHRVNVASTGN